MPRAGHVIASSAGFEPSEVNFDFHYRQMGSGKGADQNTYQVAADGP
jgi:hypothetical protein